MANRGSATQALAVLATAWIMAVLPDGAYPPAGCTQGDRAKTAVQPPPATPAAGADARAPHHRSRGPQP